MFKEMLEKIGEKNRERKEKFKELDESIRMQEIIEDRKKSSNERELERYMNEFREKEIKDKLNFVRKKRENEINLGHNPLNIKNIIKDNKKLLKGNLFKQKGNMFTNQPNVIRGNKNLFNKGNLGLCR